MSLGDPEKSWWERPKVVISVLTIVAGSGLVSVFIPLGLGWSGELSGERVQFYVTQVGVPLLTFAGFLAVYLGFLSQREQNELQKRQIEAQQANFEKDRFESTFFQLLRTHNQIVEDINCTEWRPYANAEISRARGRICFEEFFSSFKKQIETPDNVPGHGAEGTRYLYKEDWFDEHKPQLNHYFNNLTKIISFVDESDVEDKQFYIDLIIAQMSVPELVLFFYHVAALRDRKGYAEGVYDLLGKYTFFEQIDPERSLIHESHADLHPEALGVQR